MARWALFGNRAAGNVGEETVYTKHQKLPQTSKHYKQSSLYSSVLVIVGVPFGVPASVASSLCGASASEWAVAARPAWPSA